MKLSFLATIGTATLLAGSVFASVKPADAALLNGTLNFTGNVAFTPTAFNFFSQTIPTVPNLFTGATSSGSFASLVPNGSTTGNAIANVPNAPGTLPLNFLAFDATTFRLDSLALSLIPIGPFGNIAVVNVAGVFINGTDITPAVGTFTAQALGQVGTTSYSASISTVPEPSEVAGTVLLGALGSMFLVGNRKRLGFAAKS